MRLGLLCLLSAPLSLVSAFAPPSRLVMPTATGTPSRHYVPHLKSYYLGASFAVERRMSTQLQAVSFAGVVATVKAVPVARAVVVLASFILSFAVYKRRKYLFRTDPSLKYPLPEGAYGGCPLIGSNYFSKNAQTGLGNFMLAYSTKLGNPRIFKLLALGNPMAVVSGSQNARSVLGAEFQESGVEFLGGDTRTSTTEMLGSKSILFSRDGEEHSYLRRLVGQSMSPEEITKAIPTLVKVVTRSIDHILRNNEYVVMEEVCTDYTLNVAYSQILGLGLEESDIPQFRNMVNTWIRGSFSPRVLFLPFFKRSKAFQARTYLVNKIQQKIDQVEASGESDGSTIAAMVVAQDEESTKKLTHAEIIDNALILILAGTETSASTLTNALLFLGLHPQVYDKLKAEQEQVREKHGEVIDRSILDKECPYLDAVIKETMRIRPIAAGGTRTTTAARVVDGKQVPKGWPIQVSVELTHVLDPVTRVEDGSHMDIKKGFLPERWLDPTTRPGADWMAFGWGPRYCLGANLAMAEMKVFLSMFARRVPTFELVNGTTDIKWKVLSIIPKPFDGTVISVLPSETVPAV
jgi:cytochrome P450